MKKMLAALLALLIIGSAVFLFKELSSKKSKNDGDKSIEAVIPTVVIETVFNEDIPIEIEASGSLIAKRRLELYAEVQGVMKTRVKDFKPGVFYKKGEVLVGISSAEYYASLLAQKSKLLNDITAIMPDLRLDFSSSFQAWDTYLNNFRIDGPVLPLPEPNGSKEKLFVSGKNIYTTYYNVKNMEIKWSKYTLKAPFSGVLISAQVTPGTLIRVGQKIGEFIDPSSYEMEVSLTSSILDAIDTNDEVMVKSLESDKSWLGKIVRINAMLDQASQTAKVYVNVSGEGLKEGKYLTASIQAQPVRKAYRVDRKLLVDKNKVYIVKDNKLKLVDVGVKYLGKQSAVVTGLVDNAMLVSNVSTGIYEGMEVKTLERNNYP